MEPRLSHQRARPGSIATEARRACPSLRGGYDDRRDDSRRPSFWKTAPGILTGVAALLTAVTGLIAVLRQPPTTDAAPTRTTQVGESQGVAAPAGGGDDPAAGPAGLPSPMVVPGPDLPGCLSGFFAGIPDARVRPISSGARDELLLASTQSKTAPAGLVLRDAGGVVGALRYSFRPEGQSFAVEGVVDAACRPVERLANDSRPGSDPRRLQNWDDLRMTIGPASYVLAFGYSGGQVEANYFRRVVE